MIKKIGMHKMINVLKRLFILGVIMVTLCVMIVIVTNLTIYFSVKNNIKTEEEASALEADCIIVLGAGVRDDGKPTWMLEDRITVGTNLYHNGTAPKLIMSGDHGRVEYDEVNTMKNYACNAGVPSEDVFMDHAGFSTYETMYRAKEVFQAKKVVIVTQKYHLYRALYDAKRLGLEAYGVSASLRDYTKMQYYREVREWMARTKDFFQLFTKPEPTYLGDTIDLTGSGDVTNDKE